MTEKIKEWFKTAGWTKVGWLAGAVIAYIFGLSHIASAAIGIFVYININIIIKLYNEGLKKISNKD